MSGPYQAQIYQQALSAGIPPSIALAVAQQESGGFQYTSSGKLVTGSSGEIGIFQLMPATAASLGVDPSDPNQNIAGGISFLAQLYQKFGDWAKALSAYNSGSPTGSPSYANSVLSMAGAIQPQIVAPDASYYSTDSGDSGTATPSIPGAVIVGAVLGGAALLWWVLD